MLSAPRLEQQWENVSQRIRAPVALLIWLMSARLLAERLVRHQYIGGLPTF